MGEVDAARSLLHQAERHLAELPEQYDWTALREAEIRAALGQFTLVRPQHTWHDWTPLDSGAHKKPAPIDEAAAPPVTAK